MNFNPLNEAEKKVIIDKGTEPPFSGKYTHFKEEGVYACKRCGAPLYKSDNKFDSQTGWPSFDEDSFQNIKQIPDSDGIRTEIVCKQCGAHLGHIFKGEGFTPQNTRHCVNSICLNFTPQKAPSGKAYFAGGCFWGVEYFLKNAKGVIDTQAGYMGGTKDNPSYEEVCYTGTGHAETIAVTFDPQVTSFEALAKLFFEIHDPTQIDRQGPDVGEQYRSVIFYTDEAQKQAVEKLIKQLSDKGYKVATSLEKAGTFWKAEEYHQDYYEKTGKKPYCHFRTKRF